MKRIIMLSAIIFFCSSLLSATTRDEAYQKALNGDVEAMFSMGAASYKEMNKDPLYSKVYAKDAFYWMKQSAQKGYAPAQSTLGHMYHYGEGTEVDHGEYFFWSMKSAKSGHVPGKLGVAMAYLKGHGVEQNFEKARKWLLDSSPESNNHAQYLIGYCYELGQGFPMDLKKAFEWYVKSQKNGNPQARVRLDALCEHSDWACN